MAVLIGIDEAGYGPVLGPLVVSSAAFDLAPGCEDADLWDLLGDAVAPARRNAGPRLLVADSKAVYSGGRGLADLERAALAFLTLGCGAAPASFRELIQDLCGESADLGPAGWWNDLALPAAAAPDQIGQAVDLLQTQAGRASFAGFAARVVHPRRFNELVDRHRNKSVLLFQENAALIEQAMKRHAGPLSFVIDKHGGRHYYAPLLAANFFGVPVRTVRESPKHSAYELTAAGRRLRFAFAEKADAGSLPVALASMVSKYVRELFMMGFNAHWCGRVVGLAPTAGYPSDSARFLGAIRPHITAENRRDIVREC